MMDLGFMMKLGFDRLGARLKDLFEYFPTSFTPHLPTSPTPRFPYSPLLHNCL
jgi:hypothetical protein